MSEPPHAYATTNGRGVIGIGERDTLDGDDCLAQLILHELCHALVQGEALMRPGSGEASHRPTPMEWEWDGTRDAAGRNGTRVLAPQAPHTCGSDHCCPSGAQLVDRSGEGEEVLT